MSNTIIAPITIAQNSITAPISIPSSFTIRSYETIRSLPDYPGESIGGNGASDSGKLATFTSDGHLGVKRLTVGSGEVKGEIREDLLRIKDFLSIYIGDIITENLTANRTYVLPNNDGVFAMTSDLHNAVTVTGNGISLSGQQISLTIGTGATQVAAGNHGHTAAEVGAVGLTGNETVGGNKNLTGQTTMPNQTASAADSAMTRKLDPVEQLLNTFNVWIPYGQYRGHAAGGGTLGTNGFQLPSACRCGTANANAWARTIISSDTVSAAPAIGGTAYYGKTAIPLAVSLAGAFDPSDKGCVLRVCVGDSYTTSQAPPLANANALSARGFGAELFYSVPNARREIKLFAHDGVNYIESSAIAFEALWYLTTHLIVASNGAGRIRLYGAIANTECVMPRPTVLLELATGGPTNGNYGKSGVANNVTVTNGAITVVSCANPSLAAPTIDSYYAHKTSLVALNTDL